MFKKLFGHKSADSEFINSYPNRDKYIVRTKSWDWLNEKEIVVTARVNDKLTMLTFEFWPQEIFLDANGQITVRDLIKIAKQQYIESNMSIPDNLDKELIEALESLIHEFKIVEFSEKKVTLLPGIEKPMSQQ